MYFYKIKKYIIISIIICLPFYAVWFSDFKQ